MKAENSKYEHILLFHCSMETLELIISKNVRFLNFGISVTSVKRFLTQNEKDNYGFIKSLSNDVANSIAEELKKSTPVEDLIEDVSFIDYTDILFYDNMTNNSLKFKITNIEVKKLCKLSCTADNKERPRAFYFLIAFE